MTRAFVAVVPPADVLDAIAVCKWGDLAGVRRSRREQWHVTLARCKSPTDLRAAVAAVGAGPVGPAWMVDEVVLFESRTRREGAEYVERATFRLHSGGP